MLKGGCDEKLGCGVVKWDLVMWCCGDAVGAAIDFQTKKNST